MSDLLDRPIWHSLTTHLSHLAIGNDDARRFHPEVNLFLAAREDTTECMASAVDLVPEDGEVYMIQVPEICVPDGLDMAMAAQGVQMVFDNGDAPAFDTSDIVPLTDRDVPEMLALATLTEPGPFLSRTHEMSQFWGVRIDGRLAAMAGERMRFPGYSEVSGVCTHPDFRGRGLAKRLSAHVRDLVLARGETPFLHAWSTNAAAIGLYEGLGFVLRCHVNAVVLRRTAGTGDNNVR